MVAEFVGLQIIVKDTMSIIKDIRLYRSLTGNIDVNALLDAFSNKELNGVIHRIVMKLREKKFSLGDFDHLYINFTKERIPD